MKTYINETELNNYPYAFMRNGIQGDIMRNGIQGDIGLRSVW